MSENSVYKKGKHLNSPFLMLILFDDEKSSAKESAKREDKEKNKDNSNLQQSKQGQYFDEKLKEFESIKYRI